MSLLDQIQILKPVIFVNSVFIVLYYHMFMCPTHYSIKAAHLTKHYHLIFDFNIKSCSYQKGNNSYSLSKWKLLEKKTSNQNKGCWQRLLKHLKAGAQV